MGDILVTSIWNRILISNFGIPATPVGLLIALRYLLSPISLWAGSMSDKRPLWGTHRIAYIWLGRGMIVASLPLLGLSVVRLGENQADVLGWTVATLSSLLYGFGTLISGSPFLALVRDSAPPEKQGLSISTAETALITFFAITGITFSFWMPEYDLAIFWQMIIATMVLGGFFWFFAVVGVEREIVYAATPANVASTSFLVTFRKIWGDRRTRLFFYFLSLSTLAAWMQDVILEPFGAELFDLLPERTTRFNSYWQTATLITLIGGAYRWRDRLPEQQSRVAGWGLTIMAGGMAMLALTAFAHQVRLIEVALLLFGAGFGLYTFGGLSLMAVMCADEDAGAYLGLWTISILLFKGLGNFLGGSTRDLFLLVLNASPGLTYGLVFSLAAMGLLGATVLLARVDILGFARDHGRRVSTLDAQVSLAD